MKISKAFALVIKKSIDNGTDHESAIKKVFDFMDKKGLSLMKTNVITSLLSLIKKDTRSKTLNIYSPYKLEENQKRTIEKRYKTTETKETIDDSLIGGIRIEHNHTYIDTTIKNALKILSQAILKN